MANLNLEKAAQCGEPSYVWRLGQERRLNLLRQSAGKRLSGWVLENGCGVGIYVQHLEPIAGMVVGLEYDFERAVEARGHSAHITNAAGEQLPFPAGSFDLILSHEVLEHVQDDRLACKIMKRWRLPAG